jgi:CHAT domain-containing protein
MADPLGDLGGAAAEREVAVRALGPDARVSGAATSVPASRERLWEASDASVLHVASHVAGFGHWRALQLSDGQVSPVEIIQHHLAPRMAILASCGSAEALDEGGWGSIAAALLEAGTSTVVATDRSVQDDIALEIVREFYAQPDWRIDPARALATVQAALDQRYSPTDLVTHAASWAAFSVLARPPEVRSSSKLAARTR